MTEPFQNHPAPWRPIREADYIYFAGPGDEDKYGLCASAWADLSPEEQAEHLAKPFVRVLDAKGGQVVTNHDLFTFRDPAIAKAIAALPALIVALQGAFCSLTTAAGTFRASDSSEAEHYQNTANIVAAALKLAAQPERT